MEGTKNNVAPGSDDPQPDRDQVKAAREAKKAEKAAKKSGKPLPSEVKEKQESTKVATGGN